MSDIERLLAAFETGALLRPSADVLNIVDLARALGQLAGSDGIESTSGSRLLEEVIGPADHLIFIMADGLGMNLIEESLGHRFLSCHRRAELRTIFPSTTPVVLTAFATGQWPNQHGVTGQWTHLHEIRGAGALLPFASRSGKRSLSALGVTVEQAFPLPSIAHRMNRKTHAVFPAEIANSRSSGYFGGNGMRYGYRILGQAIDIVATAVQTAESPTYSYIYAPRIDLEAHRYGTRHPAVQAAIDELEHELERLALRLAGRGRIVVTADHGMLDTPITARHWIRPTPDLFESLEYPPTGDARVMYLHVREGALNHVRHTFRERYGDHFFVISVEEAERHELFGPGPLSPLTRSRIGDLIVVSAGAAVLEYIPSGSVDRVLTVASHHSGLSPAEMRVPLFVI